MLAGKLQQLVEIIQRPVNLCCVIPKGLHLNSAPRDARDPLLGLFDIAFSRFERALRALCDRRPDNRVQRKWRAANNAITTRWTRKRRQNSQRYFSGQSAMASATVPTSINPDANSAMISAVENSVR